ncbi:uncharacterized protein FYW61_005515 [Anableps anableps]
MSRERAEMDHARAPETQESKADKKLIGSTSSPAENKKRPIRRVKSPSAPRAWLSRSYKPKFGGHVYRPRSSSADHHSFHKAGFTSQSHHYLKHRAYVHCKDYPPPKPRLLTLKEKETQREKARLKEKEREKQHHDQRESTDGSSPSKQNTSRPVLPRSTSSRDKDMQITVYYQECEMFGLVAKMLIAKDPSLERPIQSSLQENLRDIGKRCVDAMERFIEDYDSRELLH